MGDLPRQLLPLLLAVATAGWSVPAAATWVDGPVGAEDASLVGEGEGDWAGVALALVGDVDGDGRGDLLVGAHLAEAEPAEHWVDAGRAYLLLGPTQTLDAPLSTAAVTYLGITAGDHLGRAMAGVGDMDGDGLDEFVLGAPDRDGAEVDVGQVYLCYGDVKWGQDLGAIPVTDCSSSFLGEAAGDQAGWALAGLGDVDKDGRPDFAIGAPGANDLEGGDVGKVYLVRAANAPWPHDAGLGGPFIQLVGENFGDRAGQALDGGHDVTGDGVPDFLIGAPGSDDGGADAGKTYLLPGSDSIPFSWDQLSGLPGPALTSFVGSAPGIRSGEAVALMGDTNSDGRSEIAIGAPFASASGDTGAEEQQGAVYLFLGRPEQWTAVMALDEADAVFTGEAGGDLAGSALAGAGDINDDGLGDLLIGAYGNDSNGNASGAAYLLLGVQIGFGGGGPLPENTIPYFGEGANDHLGYSLAGGADVAGTGIDDLVLGAPSSDQGGGTEIDPWDGAGKTYVLRGWTCWDFDGDTHPSDECGGEDCNDADNQINPDADELCDDGEDNDCDGLEDDEDPDCQGDDDAGDDDDDDADDPGYWGGGGLVCGSGELRQSAALPLPVLLLAVSLGLRRRPGRS